MTLETAIQELNDLTADLAGMRLAPDYPPESVGAFPFGVWFAGSGTYSNFGMGSILDREEHFISGEIHVARRDLPRDVESAVPFADRLVDKLQANKSLNAAVDLILSLEYTFGPLEWNGVQTLGYSFTLGVMIDNC